MEYLDKIFLGDGLAGMKIYPDNSIDMILCDLPYGMTDCAWDDAQDFGLLWSQYWRILKDNGAVVLTAAQPFTTDVINSCRRFFRYCWYWQKNMPTGFTFAKYQPMRCIEDVCVFYKKSADIQSARHQTSRKADSYKRQMRNGRHLQRQHSRQGLAAICDRISSESATNQLRAGLAPDAKAGRAV